MEFLHSADRPEDTSMASVLSHTAMLTCFMVLCSFNSIHGKQIAQSQSTSAGTAVEADAAECIQQSRSLRMLQYIY